MPTRGFVERYLLYTFVFDDSYAQLRGIFFATYAELGVPGGGPGGLTLGSLRLGGATSLH